MEPIYHWDIIQGTPEWEQIRLGKLTGSDFHVFLSSQKDKKDEKLAEKAAELVLGDSDREHHETWAMERGHLLEPEARRLYNAITENEAKEVGFVSQGRYIGCSPDGVVLDDGLIEIKCPMARNFIIWKGKNYIKPEYRTQMQYNLYVTQRKWCDFFVYHPRLGFYMERVEADPEYQQRIREALEYCIPRLEELENECLC